QIDKCRRIASLAREKMLVDPQDLRAGPTGQLRDALFDEMMIPALDGCTADRMGARQLALADASVVTVEDLKTVRLRRAIARTDARKAMTEIAAATGTMIFGHGRVRQGGVISAVAVGHRQAALAVMCRG